MARIRGIAIRFRRGAAAVQRTITKSAAFHCESKNYDSQIELCHFAAIYILGDRRGDPAPVVEELTPQRAFLSLVANTFATNTLDSHMRAKEFEILARLAPSVPIRVLCAHQDAEPVDRSLRSARRGNAKNDISANPPAFEIVTLESIASLTKSLITYHLVE